MAVTVLRVNCFLCSQPALDFVSYKQHMTSFHQVQCGEDVILAVQLLGEQDRASLVEKSKPGLVIFRGNGQAKQSQEVRGKKKETTIEELADVQPRAELKPKNKILQIGGNSQFRKRKSMVAIKEDAVANKIKLFSQVKQSTPGPSNPRTTRTLQDRTNSTKSLVRERKNLEVVNNMLMKTLEDHRNGKMTADDTISNFDEIFATNWPSDMDESIEGNFDLIYCEEDAAATEEESEDSGEPVESERVQDQDGQSLEEQNEESSVTTGDKEEKIEEFSQKKTESSPASVIPSGLSGQKDEEQEVRYKCDSCGKDFKFLTYLKGHQNSKTNCNSKEIKNKRQSMNVSYIF